MKVTGKFFLFIIKEKEPKRKSLIVRKVLVTADIMLYWQDKRVIGILIVAKIIIAGSE